MIASLDMVRLPLGAAQRQALRLSRRGFASEARFARQLLAMRLQTMPLPLPQMTTLIFFATWEEPRALARFRADALDPWATARERLALDLRPLHSFGSWRGDDPLVGCADVAGGPVLQLTHSRTRARSMARFMIADRTVVRSLRLAPGHIWAGGFVDRLQSWDTGTLSLWHDAEAASHFAHGAGAHRDAVAAERRAGWFRESWFARFGVTAADGCWRGIEVESLARMAERASVS